MVDGTSARDRFQRLLHVFPAASQEGGVALEDLARDLGVDPATVLDDLTEATARSYDHRAGSGDDIQIRIEHDRVGVWTTGAFRRPVKLSPMEAFCLALGLRRGRRGPRTSGDGGGDDPAGDPSLLRRVERHLASGPVPEGPLDGIHARDAAPDPEGVREVLLEAARECVCCRLRYLKPTASEPEDRVIHPHALAHAEGHWYVIGWCEASGGARVFRLDRILDAEVGTRGFDPEEEPVDVEAFLEGGRVYHADREIEVVVRYSPAVARWVRERAPDAEPDADGSVLLRHRVADPHWVVRHVLAYGGEAEVVEPEEVRDLLRG